MCIVHEGGMAQANQLQHRARARRHRHQTPAVISSHLMPVPPPPFKPPWRPTSPVSLRFTYGHVLSHTSRAQLESLSLTFECLSPQTESVFVVH